jgi:hypothetical protein
VGQASKTDQQGEFLEFRLSQSILGLGLKALIFWFFWIKPKEQHNKITTFRQILDSQYITNCFGGDPLKTEKTHKCVMYQYIYNCLPASHKVRYK